MRQKAQERSKTIDNCFAWKTLAGGFPFVRSTNNNHLPAKLQFTTSKKRLFQAVFSFLFYEPQQQQESSSNGMPFLRR